ncbi:MAG: (2Fe-2S)-binding protein [Firmicutes bacterium]|nr:(2Fe-2S)-binding protein [Bacillota bacterium]
MRIKNHPVLNFDDRQDLVEFTFDGKTYTGVLGEPIACALHNNGVMILGHSHTGRSRGLYCAIGNCSACLASVNGQSNIRLCTTKLEEGMVIIKQHGRGIIKINN